MEESLNSQVLKSFTVGPRYQISKILGHGSYGIVVEALDTMTGEPVAIKRLNKVSDTTDIKRTMREIKIMRSFQHDSILHLKRLIHQERAPSKLGEIFLVLPLMETDLSRIRRSDQALTPDHIQYFTYNLLRALKYMHSANIIHRDIKPSNILINSDCSIKVCDFGLSRMISNGQSDLTEYVVTRYYRAPEIMLSSHIYDKSVDIWSTGCTFGELLARKVLFPGANYIQQIDLILQVLGTPSPEDMNFIANPHARRFVENMRVYRAQSFEDFVGADTDPVAIDLLKKMLAFSPEKRITAEEALKHPYFADIHDSDDEPEAGFVVDFSVEESDITLEQGRELLLQEIALLSEIDA